MKKIYFILAVCCATLFSCTPEKFVAQEDEFVTVNFSLTADGVSLTEEMPLTKGANNAIYGIKVTEYVNYGHSDETKEYCYGLYDDVSNLSITFRKGYHYDFMVEYVPNGKNEFKKYGTEYQIPFCRFPHISHSSSIKFNQINYDFEDTLYLLGEIHLKPVEHYVFRDWDFVPSENGMETLELEKGGAGLTFVYESVEGYTYNNVNLKILNANYDYNYSTKITDKNKVVIPLIALWVSHTPGENGVQKTEQLEVAIGTNENEGAFFRGYVEIKANTMRTYTVLLQPQGTNTGNINFTYQNGAMEQENQGYLN